MGRYKSVPPLIELLQPLLPWSTVANIIRWQCITEVHKLECPSEHQQRQNHNWHLQTVLLTLVLQVLNMISFDQKTCFLRKAPGLTKIGTLQQLLTVSYSEHDQAEVFWYQAEVKYSNTSTKALPSFDIDSAVWLWRCLDLHKYKRTVLRVRVKARMSEWKFVAMQYLPNEERGLYCIDCEHCRDLSYKVICRTKFVHAILLFISATGSCLIHNQYDDYDVRFDKMARQKYRTEKHLSCYNSKCPLWIGCLDDSKLFAELNVPLLLRCFVSICSVYMYSCSNFQLQVAWASWRSRIYCSNVIVGQVLVLGKICPPPRIEWICTRMGACQDNLLTVSSYSESCKFSHVDAFLHSRLTRLKNDVVTAMSISLQQTFEHLCELCKQMRLILDIEYNHTW